MLVAIAVAVLLIASVALGVVYGRNLNQQREVETRAKLAKAFQALFPGNENQRGNLNSDFGYNPTSPGAPPTSYYTLAGLVDRTAITTAGMGYATPSAFTGSFSLGAASPGGWNGPYWTDPVDASNRPLDGWGRPLQLRYISTSAPPGWQVFSLGANGRSDTGDQASAQGDDLVYPNPPYVVPSGAVVGGTITLTIQITNNSGSTSPATQVQVVDSIQTLVTGKQAIPKNQTRTYTFASLVKSGPITLTVTNAHGAVSTTPANPYAFTLSATPTSQTIVLTIP